MVSRPGLLARGDAGTAVVMLVPRPQTPGPTMMAG